jgi:hypothetical protein
MKKATLDIFFDDSNLNKLLCGMSLYDAEKVDYVGKIVDYYKDNYYQYTIKIDWYLNKLNYTKETADTFNSNRFINYNGVLYHHSHCSSYDAAGFERMINFRDYRIVEDGCKTIKITGTVDLVDYLLNNKEIISQLESLGLRVER